jgi:hypothetical protein
MNHGLHAPKSDLGQLVFCREQGLLGLKHGEQIGGALAILKLGDLKGFTTKRQGSGVGLTLVRQIATAHGTAVDVAPTPGGGATVSLRF